MNRDRLWCGFCPYFWLKLCVRLVCRLEKRADIWLVSRPRARRFGTIFSEVAHCILLGPLAVLMIMSAVSASVTTMPRTSLVHPKLERLHDPGAFNQAVACVAEVVYFEARSESKEGRDLVMVVLANRWLRSSSFDTFCQIAWQPASTRGTKQECHFSYTCDGKLEIIKETRIHEKLLREAMEFLSRLRDGHFDQRGGVNHYYSHCLRDAPPKWAEKKQVAYREGCHTFYRDPSRVSWNEPDRSTRSGSIFICVSCRLSNTKNMGSMRSKKLDEEYKNHRENGSWNLPCVLCGLETITDFNFWKISANDFPYDRIAKTHHMLIPKRHTREEKLLKKEHEELEMIK